MALRNIVLKDTNISSALNQLRDQLRGFDTRFLLYFASTAYEPSALSAEIEKAFPEIPKAGCTSAGEIASGQMLKQSLVVLALDSDMVDWAGTSMVSNPGEDKSVDRAFEPLVSTLGVSMNHLDPSVYLGIVLHDGLSVAEEKVMDRISDLTNTPFVGGSAGDDLKFESTHVFIGGKALKNTSVLALLRLKRPYHILKTQSFDVLDETLKATEVDESTRTVISFNDEPAALAYAKALGVTVEELPGRFQSNPLGLIMDNGEPFVRSPQQVLGSKIVFYCYVKQGMEMRVLRSRNIVEDTVKDLETKIKQIGSPITGIVNFHCILRTLELEAKGQSEEYGSIFKNIPTIGFSTYGESYIGHINQTSTIVLFT